MNMCVCTSAATHGGHTAIGTAGNCTAGTTTATTFDYEPPRTYSSTAIYSHHTILLVVPGYNCQYTRIYGGV